MSHWIPNILWSQQHRFRQAQNESQKDTTIDTFFQTRKMSEKKNRRRMTDLLFWLMAHAEKDLVMLLLSARYNHSNWAIVFGRAFVLQIFRKSAHTLLFKSWNKEAILAKENGQDKQPKLFRWKVHELRRKEVGEAMFWEKPSLIFLLCQPVASNPPVPMTTCWT